jgi:hypothetical protein
MFIASPRAMMISVTVSSGERWLSGSTNGGYLDDNVGGTA